VGYLDSTGGSWWDITGATVSVAGMGIIVYGGRRA
jgi:drug/metabolite transporter superfamily protein YnfA